MSGALRKVMVIFAVLFVLMGITISQAFMLPGFLLALLYFVYDIFSQRDYEYKKWCGFMALYRRKRPLWIVISNHFIFA